MDRLIINREKIIELARSLKSNNYRVIGITPDGMHYSEILDETRLVGMFLNNESALTKTSFKEYFFPKSEALFYYKQKSNAIELVDPIADTKKTVVFGAKPCDTASLPIMSKVFNWDYKDEFFNSKVENSIIIGMSCNYHDEYCFCNEVGLSQSSTKGSDIFLTPISDDHFIVDIVTKKGEEFIQQEKNFFAPMNRDEPLDTKPETERELKFDYTSVKQWLDNHFEHPFWDEAGETCLGCAQCAFVCPTCHCFDIVDEQCGTCSGTRVKNWDACQFSLFTKHASGHNPRDDQEKRYRQRISHKFKYYNDKFGEILCTGCGRCSRGCPVSIDILEMVEQIDSLSHTSEPIN
jgi:ferredoxin